MYAQYIKISDIVKSQWRNDVRDVHKKIKQGQKSMENDVRTVHKNIRQGQKLKEN